jgi:hypothetical protein
MYNPDKPVRYGSKDRPSLRATGKNRRKPPKLLSRDGLKPAIWETSMRTGTTISPTASNTLSSPAGKISLPQKLNVLSTRCRASRNHRWSALPMKNGEKKWWPLAFVEELPRNTMGKVLKEDIKKFFVISSQSGG